MIFGCFHLGFLISQKLDKFINFLSEIGEIKYRIIRYIPVGNLSKRPTEEDIDKAVLTAKRYHKM